MTKAKYLTIDEQEGISVVGFAEPTLLDAYHVDQVSRELVDLVEKQQVRRLVIDLSTIKMISSQSLSVFLNLHHQLEQVGGRLALAGIDPNLYRVFKVTRLHHVFTFFPDAAAAVAALKDESS